MNRMKLAAWLSAVALLSLAAEPARGSTMEEVYQAVRIEGLTTRPTYVAGELVVADYSLVNRSGTTLTIPLTVDPAMTGYMLGIVQHWIERLGGDKRIPSIPPQIFFDGARYAAGGWILVDGQLPQHVWAANVAIPVGSQLDTTGYPTGDYRFYVEYKRLYANGGTVVQTASVGFHVNGAGSTDTTPPVLTVPSDMAVDATSSAGAVVTFTATATDAVDPAPAVACLPPSGTLFPIGSNVVTCTATDASRNVSQASFEILVRGAADQLGDLLAQVQGAGPGGSLAAKLRAAEAALASGRTGTACRTLAAFVHEVEAQAGKSIDATLAAGFIGSATRIRALLGC